MATSARYCSNRLHRAFILLAQGEDPSRITVFAGIDLPSRLIESLVENEPISTGVGILRRLENANGSIPPYTVHRED
jgi:hypothetical protein